MDPKPSSVREEILQERPFPSLGQEAIVSLLRTTDLVRRLLQAAVGPYGVTLQQYNVLRILRGAGEAGLPTLEIAARMIEQTPGITRLLDNLEGKGLVRRERGGEDRRQVRCFITPPALTILEQLDPVMDRVASQSVALVSPSETAALLDLLDKLRAGCRGALSPGKPKEGSAPPSP